mgnify:FL=1
MTQSIPLTIQSIPLSAGIPRAELAPHEFAIRRHRAAEIAANVLRGNANATFDVGVRDTLPFQDLELDALAGTADSRDQWALPALTLGTNLAWINAAVDVNKVQVVYGCFNLSALPPVAVLRLEGGSKVKYEYQLEKTHGDLMDVTYFPEVCVWTPQETILVRVIPRRTVALGERFGLLAVTAEQLGQRFSGNDTVKPFP